MTKTKEKKNPFRHGHDTVQKHVGKNKKSETTHTMNDLFSLILMVLLLLAILYMISDEPQMRYSDKSETVVVPMDLTPITKTSTSISQPKTNLSIPSSSPSLKSPGLNASLMEVLTYLHNRAKRLNTNKFSSSISDLLRKSLSGKTYRKWKIYQSGWITNTRGVRSLIYYDDATSTWNIRELH